MPSPAPARLLASLALVGTLTGCAALPSTEHTSQGRAPGSITVAEDRAGSTPTPSTATATEAAPSAPASAATPPPGPGSALAAVSTLVVGGRGPMTGYDRDAFGQAWYDADRNGCDTRNDVLRRDLVDRVMKNDCKVLAGTRAPDPYTGRDIRFEVGGASELDVDHVVALGDAWQTGAAQWGPAKRYALANDPLELLAVDASANRQKGDGDTATWLPANKAFRCAYVARQVAVKQKYRLRVTPAERDAMVRVLSRCGDLALPGPGAAPTRAPLPRTRVRTEARAETRTETRDDSAPRGFADTGASSGSQVVHPGAFCTPVGATGVTTAGTPMGCSTKPGDDRARWRSR
ncbi:hypothetical protein GCM10011519_24960 [Marmoricola endophyticus]|uniref:GmrSD restriction endonucleases C-terminal domain-containing protein n=1 Tax=Marmoricola endophyticus TaxID=2040280 RepID=A0A917F4N1_9ACTN|nr:HNH endonuclease family protein [Marmoricola endophyticus]GGF49957.1 hypothetical protein GCM10011519_24960 [Marmoricola endophyticus]